MEKVYPLRIAWFVSQKHPWGTEMASILICHIARDLAYVW